MNEDNYKDLKLVQIDDAGIGSPIGGAAIGALETESGIFIHKLIGEEYFQDGQYTAKEYQDHAIGIVSELFQSMGVTKETHRVEICSGHIFDHVRLWLDEHGYNWKSVKIEGHLQLKIEDAFSDYLVSIGVPEKIHRIEVGRDQFMYLFNWVQEDPDSRIRYCKTNGTKWRTSGPTDFTKSQEPGDKKISRNKQRPQECYPPAGYSTFF